MSSKYDLPPKYDEVVDMHGVANNSETGADASAPLLAVDLNSSTAIKIVKEETKRRYGSFKFYIRDSASETLILQGEVGYKRSAVINGPDGNALISITEIDDPDPRYLKNEEFKNCAQFNISRGTTSLGLLALGPYWSSAWNFAFINEQGNRPYSFKVVDNKETEIMISKNDTGDYVHLVSIICPEKKGYEPFECSIQWSAEKADQPMTQDEKELIISMAVTYMTCRNGPIMTRGEHNFWAGLGYVIGISIVVLIIVGLVYLFIHLNDNCNRPGYKCSGSKRY